MDCVIPPQSIRPFCAAIGTLSRIGKELYVDFDPMQGLILRSLNDAKSAFCSFQWEPSFFEKCTSPPPVAPTVGRRRTLVSLEQDQQYSCRVPLKALAAVVKPRRGVVSLRIRDETHSQHSYISFEFQIQMGGGKSSSEQASSALLRVVHRIGVAADADMVDAIAPTDGRSDFVVDPKLFIKMLEPLKGASEVALIVDDTQRVVTATSFHHGDTTSSDNALLQASNVSFLKSETSIGVDEFYDFEFKDDRVLPDNTDGAEDYADVPPNVNESVVLVFSMREVKAMLQFCAHAQVDRDLRVTVAFHWGGRPVTFATEGESFSVQLMMATLEHQMLNGVKPSRKSAAGKNTDEG